MAANNETDVLFDEAIRLEQHGEWDKAVVLYEQLADKWPEQATYARNCIDRLRAQQSTVDEAAKNLEEEFRLSKRNWATGNKIGKTEKWSFVISGVAFLISIGLWLLAFLFFAYCDSVHGSAVGFIGLYAAICAVPIAFVGALIALIGMICVSITQRRFPIRLVVSLAVNALAGLISMLLLDHFPPFF